MTTIAVVEPHTLYRLGIVRLLTDNLPEARLLGMDYSSLDDKADPQACELLLLSVPSAEASRVLLDNAQRILRPEAVLLMADTHSALPSPYESASSVVGHLLKNASPELMTASVNLVLAGGTCFPSPALAAIQAINTQPPPSPAFSSTLITAYQPMRWPPEDADLCEPHGNEAELLGLTPRQYEVLVLLARGMTIKGVARELAISAATAKAHAETLYMRMNVNNRNEAVYQAVSKGARLGIPMRGS